MTDARKPDTVNVRALKTFRHDWRDPETHVSPGAEFELKRQHAVELRANGIVEILPDAAEEPAEQPVKAQLEPTEKPRGRKTKD